MNKIIEHTENIGGELVSFRAGRNMTKEGKLLKALIARLINKNKNTPNLRMAKSLNQLYPMYFPDIEEARIMVIRFKNANS